jgi:hypothetical protein
MSRLAACGMGGLPPVQQHLFPVRISKMLFMPCVGLVRMGLHSPFCAIAIHHFHGAASRVSASKTAFAPRHDHLMVEIVADWEPQSSEEDQRHVQWAQAGSRTLVPYALKGGISVCWMRGSRSVFR